MRWSWALLHTGSHLFADSNDLARLPLEVLGMLSRGQPSGSTNQVHMRPHPLDCDATIAQLVADRHRFTFQSCIDGDRIILHLGMLASE